MGGTGILAAGVSAFVMRFRLQRRTASEELGFALGNNARGRRLIAKASNGNA